MVNNTFDPTIHLFYFYAPPTSVHPELDGRLLGIVHSLL